ncbi:hypothetical protein AJ79_06502 [Helicocarpus griseus UAMH5409]|uniref:Uncharacterized protein n=1 Tax=Helicocarpus griseus UAMH5409 TaxID=1447875 RepID=A0A2B7XCU5_9EURO|nr:hypothetical protein AJ79_06502 [Helicocarpus griseus UAMH5409]
MADGLNDARAIRVTELMNDFRTLHQHIAQLKRDPPPGEAGEEGYVLMRQCILEAQTLLSLGFNVQPTQGSSAEAEKVQLQRVIVDASARRFQAHKIYLKMAAASRWVTNRAQVLQGQKMSAQHVAGLRAVSQTLHSEVAAITDSSVVDNLRTADINAGYWLGDDPSLSTILNWIRTQN